MPQRIGYRLNLEPTGIGVAGLVSKRVLYTGQVTVERIRISSHIEQRILNMCNPPHTVACIAGAKSASVLNRRRLAAGVINQSRLRTHRID